MSQKQIPFLTALLLFALQIFAGAESLYMGNVESVYSKSRFNAIRNPALMSMQVPENTLGVLLVYNAFSGQDVSSEFDIDSIDNESSETDIKDLLSGSVYLSWSAKFGKSALGFGVISGPENQYVTKRNSGTVTGITAVPEDYRVENKEEIKSLNPAAAFSVSRETGKNSAIGFQLITGYSWEETRSSEYQYLNMVLQSRKRETLLLRTWFAELRGGYCHREGPVETGILISSGAMCIQDSEIDYYNSTMVPVDGSSHTTPHFQNRSGASITAGGFIKFTPALGLALEGRYALPASYGKKIFIESDYTVHKVMINSEPFFSLSCGIEYVLSPVVTLSVGGSYGLLSTFIENKDGGSNRNDISIFFVSAGVDIAISKKTSLTAGIQMTGVSYTSTIQHFSLSAESEVEQHIITAILGMSLGF